MIFLLQIEQKLAAAVLPTTVLLQKDCCHQLDLLSIGNLL
jgi:hypothetical protein